MSRRKKRKLTKEAKKLLKAIFSVCIIGLLIFVTKETLFNKDNNINNKENVIKYDNYITNTSESNKERIKEFISKGMSLEEFKNTLSRKENYIEKKKESYEKINYNFEEHLTYEELENIYKELNNSDIVKIEIIGNSFDDRNIYSIEIGTGEDNIMLNGNIHSAEIAPTLFLTKYAIDLVNNWEQGNKDAKELLSKHKIIIIPTINPDGYSFSLFGSESITNKNSYTYKNSNDINKSYYKANINGVDLNRNLPSQTSGLYFSDMYLYGATSRTKSTEMYSYYSGDSVGSEPETQALIYWMYKHYKNSHAFVDVHSAGRVIYNGKQYLSDRFNEISASCAETLNKYTNYEVIGIELFDDGRGTDGNTTDMIGEVVHGYKFSTITGRLSVKEYGIKTQTLEQELCALTLETLENYTQDLDTIKSEYEDKRLAEAFTALAKLNF